MAWGGGGGEWVEERAAALAGCCVRAGCARARCELVARSGAGARRSDQRRSASRPSEAARPSTVQLYPPQHRNVGACAYNMRHTRESEERGPEGGSELRRNGSFRPTLVMSATAQTTSSPDPLGPPGRRGVWATERSGAQRDLLRACGDVFGLMDPLIVATVAWERSAAENKDSAQIIKRGRAEGATVDRNIVERNGACWLH